MAVKDGVKSGVAAMVSIGSGILSAIGVYELIEAHWGVKKQ